MTSHRFAPRFAAATALALLLASAGSSKPASGGIAAAVADKTRPAADTARDAERKPADMLAFAQVKRGQTIVDYLPGKGYFTRLFSNAVGPHGIVYADVPQLLLDKWPKDKPLPASVSAEPGHTNVHDAVAKNGSLGVPAGSADLVWTAQNYHDVHIWAGAEGTAGLNKGVFEALKPGGLYVVLDHAGAAGLDDAGMKAQHRIDESLVKREVVAAGFVLEGESDVLRNPADPHSANVFDPSIRGKTDQFVLKFWKPK
jgi:predicted methyltransferase